MRKKYFSLTEILLWSLSVILIIVSFCIFDHENYAVLVASLIGATSLILNAKGNFCGQILTENPTMTAAEVQSALFDMALDIGEVGYDADSGWGVVKTVSLTDRASMQFWTAALQGNLAQTLKNASQ